MSQEFDAYLDANRSKVASASAILGYSRDFVYDQLWERPGMSKRDRSLVTLAALVAANAMEFHTIYHTRLALENGVTREEISELLTHLGAYAGFPNASAGAIHVQTAYDMLDGATS